MNQAPTKEAKLTAVQIRQELFLAIEEAIENKWDRLHDRLAAALVLVLHVQKIENRCQRTLELPSFDADASLDRFEKAARDIEKAGLLAERCLKHDE